MARHYEDREKIRAGIGSQGAYGHYLWFAAVLFVILGIIGDAANVTIGLSATSWFLLAIFLGLLIIMMPNANVLDLRLREIIKKQ